ncbi:MAG: hypothetical protein R2697_07135 [Ilumatobacteraceae bacterium]
MAEYRHLYPAPELAAEHPFVPLDFRRYEPAEIAAGRRLPRRDGETAIGPDAVRRAGADRTDRGGDRHGEHGTVGSAPSALAVRRHRRPGDQA